MLFSIRTAADAQATSRVVEHFAMRSLLPEMVRAIRDGDTLQIEIELHDLDEVSAAIIAEKMRSSVLVDEVSLTSSVGGR